MNTPEIIEFLKAPHAGGLGTCGKDNRPWFTRLYGATGVPGENALRVFFPKVLAAVPMAQIEENDAVSVTFADMTNFQARQFKGRAVRLEDATEEDYRAMEENLRITTGVVEGFFGPGASAGWQRMVTRPAMALVLEYTKVYTQTPGPGAGKEEA